MDANGLVLLELDILRQTVAAYEQLRVLEGARQLVQQLQAQVPAPVPAPSANGVPEPEPQEVP